MALRIVFGSDTGELARRLTADIQATYRDVDPLVPATILVPNRNLEKWLRFAIARNSGVAANLNFPYLEHGLWQIVSEIGALSGGFADVTVMKSETVAARIAVSLLASAGENGGVNGAGKSALLDYCRAGCDSVAPSLADPGFAIRLWQLSDRLGRLFREYEFSRTDMVREWIAGRLVDSSSELEREQAAIYRRVFCDEASFDAVSRVRQRTLFQLAESVFPDANGKSSAYGNAAGSGAFAGPAVIDRKDTIFVFGMSSLSRYHCGLLWKISKFRDVCLYHFNTCREYWEDVSTPFEDRWRAIRQTETVPEQDSDELVFHYGLSDNPLLKAWGKAGRETVKLLADLEDDAQNVETAWIDDAAFDDDSSGAALSDSMDSSGTGPTGSVLSRVKYGILNRISDVGKCPADSSITIMSCPGVQREVEAVADEIVNILRRDASLKLSDIAVLVTTMTDYKSMISQVFGRDRNAVPYNMADSNASEDSVYGYGVKALINLAGGDFSRRAVFELLYNPCFQAAAGIGATDLSVWLKWVTELGVFHDFQGAASDPESSIYTWSQALQRIRLGRIMDPLEADAASLSTGVFPYRDSATDTAVADRFCETIERLFFRINRLLSGQKSSAEWGVALKDLFDTFLAVPEDRGEEAAVRRALYDGIFSCFADDSGFGPAIRCQPRPVELNQSVVFEVVKSLLTGIATGRGAYLSDGVTVASLKPMRPIPFRVIFVLGLAEGKFPGTMQESSLDLRIRHRRIGDVTTPDAGRYMFMETMLCASDRLVLSFDGWDTQKDERHEPCSVIRQLQNHLSRSVLPLDAEGKLVEFQVVDVPLSPFSQTHAVGGAGVPSSPVRMMDRVVGAVLAAGSADRLPKLSEVAAKAIADAGRAPGATDDIAVLKRLQAVLSGAEQGSGGKSGTVASANPLKIKVKLSDLAVFLENPMKARTRRMMHVYDDRDDPGAAFVEDEPFVLCKDAERELNALWIRDFVAFGVCEPAHMNFNARAVRLHEMSVGPAEPFQGSYTTAMLDAFENLAAKVPSDFLERRLIADVVTGLDAWQGRDPELKFPAIFLNLSNNSENSGAYEIELCGGVDFVAQVTESAPVAYVVARDSGDSPTSFSKSSFQPLLYGLMTAAYGNDDSAGLFDVIEISKKSFLTYRFRIDRSDARAYLEALILDYLDDSRLLELLPYLSVAAVVSRESIVSDEPPSNIADLTARLVESIEEKATDAPGGYYPSEAEQLLSDRAAVPTDLWQTIVRRYRVPWGYIASEKGRAPRKRGGH